MLTSRIVGEGAIERNVTASPRFSRDIYPPIAVFRHYTKRVMHRFGEATRRVRIRRFASNASSYRVLVLGGGAGGQAVSSALSRRLGKGAVGVVEPASVSRHDFHRRARQRESEMNRV